MNYERMFNCFKLILNVFVMLFIIVFFCLITTKNVLKLKAIDSSKSYLQSQLELEEVRRNEIENQRYYQESEEFKEKIAREKLGLIMPDEIIFEIIK